MSSVLPYAERLSKGCDSGELLTTKKSRKKNLNGLLPAEKHYQLQKIS